MFNGKLFCEMNPLFYTISEQKEICKRHIKNLTGKEKFAKDKQEEKLPNVVYSITSGLIKRGPGIDPVLQENKAINIDLASKEIDHLVIHPGETFSFWKTVGKTSKSKGYKDGRVIVGNRLQPGTGGGLCNLSNTLHRLVLHSPLTVTELWKHSDALAPDEGERHPFSTGTSVSYNNIDYRFRNDFHQDVQLCVWVEGETLNAELRSERAFPRYYKITEEDHHFTKEDDGNYSRVSKIYRETYDRKTDELLKKELIWDNHSMVMFDPALIPADQIR